AAVLALTQPNLSDLRIANDAGLQIQYLLERCEGVLSLELGAPAKAESKPEKNPPPGVRSRYTLTLPFETLPDSKLVLTTSERVFDRTVALQIPHPPRDARSEPSVETITEMRWRHTDPETVAPPLNVELRPLGVKTLTVVVDEGDNRPLPLSAAR